MDRTVFDLATELRVQYTSRRRMPCTSLGASPLRSAQRTLPIIGSHRVRCADRSPAARRVSNELDTALLEEKDQELMVISHSMDTIIGHDALRDLGKPGADSGVTVAELVTICGVGGHRLRNLVYLCAQ